MTAPTVHLVPWDSESTEHIDSLFQQRVQCGWHAEKVATEWRDAQRAGAKCIYWIAYLKSDLPESDEKGIAFLQDTSVAVRRIPREPSKKSFRPLGHVALDEKNETIKGLGIDAPVEDAFWIKSLYVTPGLRSSGLGRLAMDRIEAEATEEPLNARHLLLDTVHRDDALSPEVSMIAYGFTPKFANQDWYGRRGYRLIGTLINFYDIKDENGKVIETKTVFMQRDLEKAASLPR